MSTTDTDDGQSPPLTRTEPIGRFLVLRRLGVGGTAVVWSAYDPELDRKVAIKVLHASRVANSTAAGDRLRREAQALAKLNHPNVVAIYDAGTCAAPGGGKEIFIAEELVEGVDVAAWLRDRKSVV
jgi:eukaryotic-like serine/threonine-protein kinase